MAGILWKWPSRRGIWHMEDGTDSSGLVPARDIALSGTATVPGKLNDAQSFAINDFGDNPNLLNALALDTKGTLAFWIKLDPDNGAQNIIYSITKGTGGIVTDFFVDCDWRAFNNNLRMSMFIDGVSQWDVNTPLESFTPHIGNWIPVIIKHDGTRISEIKINNVSQVITRTVVTNEAAWMKALITDAVNKADTCTFGNIKRIGAYVLPLNADLDEMGAFGDVWDEDDDDAFWNDGAGQEMSEPPAPDVVEETSLFFKMFRHLLPNSKAWRI